MAELGDFYQSGAATLADVTLPTCQATSGEMVPIQLSSPADASLQVTVLEQKGQIDQQGIENMDRVRMHHDSIISIAVDNPTFHETEAADFEVVGKVNHAINPANGQRRPRYNIRGQLSTGTFNNDYLDNTFILNTVNGDQCRMTNPITAPHAGDVNLDAFWLGNWGYEDGRLMTHSTTAHVDTGDGNMAFQQKNAHRDKWNYFPDWNTWMSGVNTHDVIFYAMGASTTYFYVGGQVVDMDAANNRCRGIDMTYNTPTGTKEFQIPYDILGTGAVNNGRVVCLGKGNMTNETTQGTAIDTSALTVSFTGAPTYSADWNDYVGGILKIIDGADATKYRIYQIDGANSTTNGVLYGGYDVNGFVYGGDGNYTTWEIWTHNDVASGAVWDDDISLFTMANGTWGTYAVGMTEQFWYTGTNPVRGGWYKHDGDRYTRQTAVLYTAPFTARNNSWNTTNPLDTQRFRFCRFDFSGLKMRNGDTHTGWPLKAGSMWSVQWGNNWYSHNGTDWYSSMKDWRHTVNNFQHTDGYDSPTDTVWRERRWVKYEGGIWYVNGSGQGSTVDRWVDPEAFFTEFESESWESTIYTQLDEVDLALAEGRQRFVNVWNQPYEWEYNTRVVNNSNEDREYQISAEHQYIDDFVSQLSGTGAVIESNGWWGTTRGMGNQYATTNGWESSNDFRWVLSKNGDTVWITLGDIPAEDVNSDNIPYNKLRVIIKGTPL